MRRCPVRLQVPSVHHATDCAARLRPPHPDVPQPFAAPDVIHVSPGLPKTRSGKIMRRILRKVAAGESSDLGDVTTLADPGGRRRAAEDPAGAATRVIPIRVEKPVLFAAGDDVDPDRGERRRVSLDARPRTGGLRARASSNTPRFPRTWSARTSPCSWTRAASRSRQVLPAGTFIPYRREYDPDHVRDASARDRRDRVLLPRGAARRGAAEDPAWLTVLVAMFMHAGWLHLIGNMWFLPRVRVERRGHARQARLPRLLPRLRPRSVGGAARARPAQRHPVPRGLGRDRRRHGRVRRAVPGGPGPHARPDHPLHARPPARPGCSCSSTSASRSS